MRASFGGCMILLISIVVLSAVLFAATAADAHWTNSYDITWNTQSRNSSESMPCGGGDIGLNVWVEAGDILFYVSRSGARTWMPGPCRSY